MGTASTRTAEADRTSTGADGKINTTVKPDAASVRARARRRVWAWLLLLGVGLVLLGMREAPALDRYGGPAYAAGDGGQVCRESHSRCLDQGRDPTRAPAPIQHDEAGE